MDNEGESKMGGYNVIRTAKDKLLRNKNFVDYIIAYNSLKSLGIQFGGRKPHKKTRRNRRARSNITKRKRNVIHSQTPAIVVSRNHKHKHKKSTKKSAQFKKNITRRKTP